MRVAIGIALVAAPSVAATSASAATPIDVGAGGNVAVVVDAAGSAHLAWREGPPAQSAHRTGYCRVPRGTIADGCPTAHSFPPVEPSNSLFGRALISLDGNTVTVLWRECCPPDVVNARISSDLGTTFPATSQELAARDAMDPTSTDPVATSGDAITDGTNVGWSSGVGFQWAPLAGPPARRHASLFEPVSFDSASALHAGRPLVVGESDDKLLRFQRHQAGEVNDETNWTATKPIPTSGDGFKRPALAFDATDVFLAHSDDFGGDSDRPLLRRYLSASDSFSDPVLVADQSVLNAIDVAIDAAGDLHVVWTDGAGTAIWWARSSDRGASFSAPIRVVDNPGATGLQVGGGGTAVDPVAFAAYRTIGGRIVVVELADEEPPEVSASARRIQRAGRPVKVKASCDEACALRATGAIRIKGVRKKQRLRPAKANAAAGETKVLKLKLSGKVRKRVLKARRKRARMTARIKIRATDEQGNSTVRKLKVKLK